MITLPKPGPTVKKRPEKQKKRPEIKNPAS
jgi:hypothetical protein